MILSDTKSNINVEYIPSDLCTRDQWLLWRWDQRAHNSTGEMKWTKPPFQVHGDKASTDDPMTWTSFDQAVAVFNRGGFDGIGYVLTSDRERTDKLPGTADDGLAGVDLDHCVDPETGDVEPWAQSIVDQLASYTEISPSGTGLRVFLHGKLPPKDRKIGNFECYESGRYLTVTGHHLLGTPLTVEYRQDEMTAVHTAMFAERNEPRPTSSKPTGVALNELDDSTILDIAFAAKNGGQVQRLYQGDIGGYPGHSEADMALCAHLCFYTGGDPETIDRLFRSSDLMRPKWDEKRGVQTYGELTIGKTVVAATDFYQPYQHRASTQSQSDESEWGVLGGVPVGGEVPTLPAWMIPESLRPWLMDLAEHACVPLEMFVVPAMTALGALIGRATAIQPNRFDHFTVVPNVWGAICAGSGALKSYAQSEGTSPLNRLAKQAREDHEQGNSARNAKVESIGAEIKAIKSEMESVAKSSRETSGTSGTPKPREKTSGRTMAELEIELAEKSDQLEKAQLGGRRYITQDATTEKLGELLIANPRGLLVNRDELTGLLRTMDRAGHEGDRAFYLQAWNGNDDYTVDRIGRGEKYIEALTLSICGGIQPGRLARYVREAIAGEEGADGLLQRFQLFVWPDSLGHWVESTQWPDLQAERRAFQTYAWLDALTPELIHAEHDHNGIPFLKFSSAAQALYDYWRNDLEARLRSKEGDRTPAFISHLSKYRSLLPSLALIFHLVDIANGAEPGPVSMEATKLAAEWVGFLEEHAKKVYAEELYPGAESARLLATKIQTNSVTDGVTEREIYRHHWSGLDTPVDVSLAVSILADINWIQVETQVTGGRPTEILRIHPELRGHNAS
jgi:hypothetical protein